MVRLHDSCIYRCPGGGVWSVNMTDKDKAFLLKLADLLDEYKASFSYTTSDDGIHVSLDGREVHVGWFFQDHEADRLRAAATTKGRP
jgi:hypothetical protein